MYITHYIVQVFYCTIKLYKNYLTRYVYPSMRTVEGVREVVVGVSRGRQLVCDAQSVRMPPPPAPPPTRRSLSDHFKLPPQGWFASLSRPIKKKFSSHPQSLPRRAKSAWDITPSMVPLSSLFVYMMFLGCQLLYITYLYHLSGTFEGTVCCNNCYRVIV